MKSTLTNIKLYLSLALFLFALPMLVNAQTLSGQLTDADGPLIGATITLGNGLGTVTDIDGNYSIDLEPGRYIATASYIGYEDQIFEFTIGGSETSTWSVVLSEDAVGLESVTVVGQRTAPRSSTTTPLPIDVFRAKELTSTGQTSFDKALQYRVPSFNTVQTPVNDATSLLDPYEIRNMGPSRTLILINGKRKNMSALLYTQTSPGRGETGADISAIPTDMIKRIEILRDGASAQYGSDAIAGVMNVILKDGTDEGRFNLRTGITAAGDGEFIGAALNNGAKLGEDGFINYTIDMSKQFLANRPGTVSAAGEAADFVLAPTYINDQGERVSISAEEAAAALAEVEPFLTEKPDAGNINGSPETTAMKFAVNAGKKVGKSSEVYANAAYVYKKVNSFANYRTPYWRTIEDFPYLEDFFGDQYGYQDLNNNGILDYAGYVPTFDGDLIDYNGTVGFKSERNGWLTDVSFTTGANDQTYIVRNSHNRNNFLVPTWEDINQDGVQQDNEVTFSEKYRENSALVFDPGGTRFSHNVGNIDVTKRFSDMFSFAFGTEFRTEDFTIIEGSLDSYEAGGPDSFAGNDPRNSGKFNRYNIGGYADVALDFTDNFLVNGTARLEDYSDFGSAFVWKVSSRYKTSDNKITVRGSASTGFKAPLLHQIYTQKAQYSFIPGQGIQVGGLVSNVSREARLLGLPSLSPEKSLNLTFGLGLRPISGLSLTLDYYNIAVTDRIILSTEIGGTEEGDTDLDVILQENNLSDLSFFVNALDTRTSGIDFVAAYRGIELGAGKLSANLSGNYTIQNERVGDVKEPQIVVDANASLPDDATPQSVVNPTQEALFFTSRPQYKAILGLDYTIAGATVSINNTLFGPTTFRQQGLDEGIYTEFAPKVVTDLGLSYNFTDKFGATLNVNNVLGVLPEWEFKADDAAGEANLNSTDTDAYGRTYSETATNLISFNNRYEQMTYDGYHFSQLGTQIYLTLSYKF